LRRRPRAVTRARVARRTRRKRNKRRADTDEDAPSSSSRVRRDLLYFDRQSCFSKIQKIGVSEKRFDFILQKIQTIE